MNKDKLNKQGIGWKLSKTISELISEEIKSLEPESLTAFWDRLHEFVLQHHSIPIKIPPVEKKKTKSIKPMSDAEARCFGQQEMEFGKFKDELICNTPLTYLDWLVGENPHIMQKELARYLANEKIADRLREEIDE